MQAVVEHGDVGQSSQVHLWTWATMGGGVHPVAEVGAARELGWACECACEVAGVLVAREVAGVMAGKMKNEGLDHNTISRMDQTPFHHHDRPCKSPVLEVPKKPQ